MPAIERPVSAYTEAFENASKTLVCLEEAITQYISRTSVVCRCSEPVGIETPSKSALRDVSATVLDNLNDLSNHANRLRTMVDDAISRCVT